MNKTIYSYSLVAIMSVSLVGCTTGDPVLVQNFATAGAEFTQKVNPALNVSLNTTAQAQRAELIDFRNKVISSEERTKRLDNSFNNIDKRSAIFDDIGSFSSSLGKYFRALAALASSNAPDSAAESTKSIVGTLSALGANLSSEVINGQTVGNLIPNVTGLVIGEFQSQVLENEFRTNGPTVQRSIATLEAVFATLMAVADRELGEDSTIRALERDFIESAYTKDKVLPKDFNLRYVTYATRVSPSLATISEAHKAAIALREDFERLTAGTLSPAAVNAFARRISRLETLIGITRTNAQSSAVDAG